MNVVLATRGAGRLRQGSVSLEPLNLIWIIPTQESGGSSKRPLLSGRIGRGGSSLCGPGKRPGPREVIDVTHDGVARALTVAGSDCGGGAGIQADLKVFTLLGAYGMSALTSVTAQNTRGVAGIYNLSAEAVASQIDAVVADIGVDALKTGMLPTPEIVTTVALKVIEHGLDSLVVDPVMVAKGGAVLIPDEARRVLRDRLLPQALVVTPNIPEAEALTGLSVVDLDSMKEAAARMHGMGARNVVVKGGHLPQWDHGGALRAAPAEARAVDVFYDGKTFTELTGPWVNTKNTHGTGCSFSAAITALLARGLSVAEAVPHAKEFVSAAIRHSLPLGSGHDPTNPWAGAASLPRELILPPGTKPSEGERCGRRCKTVG